MEGCGLRQDLEAPVEEDRALLIFQTEGLSDWVSPGQRRWDCGKGADIRGLTAEGRWGRAGWEGSFHLLSPMLPGPGTMGTEGLRRGLPTSSGAHLAGWTWLEGR